MGKILVNKTASDSSDFGAKNQMENIMKKNNDNNEKKIETVDVKLQKNVESAAKVNQQRADQKSPNSQKEQKLQPQRENEKRSDRQKSDAHDAKSDQAAKNITIDNGAKGGQAVGGPAPDKSVEEKASGAHEQKKSDDAVNVTLGRGVAGTAVSKLVQSGQSDNKTSRLINVTEHTDDSRDQKLGDDKKVAEKNSTQQSAKQPSKLEKLPVKAAPLVLGAERSVESELISEDADAFESAKDPDDHAASAKTADNFANRPMRRRPIAGLAMDVKSSAMLHKHNHFAVGQSEEAQDETKEPTAASEPRFSKPKATLIAVAVALIVGIVGGLIVWLTNRPETQYCLVQFESNGGSEVESDEVVCGELVDQPNNPSKDGFDFQGWVYANEPFDFTSRAINEDIILVAKWQVQEGVETVTVKFDSDGGSEVHEQKIAKGKKASAPVGVTRKDYDLVGWYLGDTKFDFAKTAVEQNITLKAKWERKKEQSNNQNNSNTSRPNNSNNNSNNSTNNNSSDKKPSTTVTGIFVASQKMKRGDVSRVEVSISPNTAKYKLTVVSTNNAVATCAVSSGNQLECSAVGEGKATITVRDNNSNRSASFEITVEPVQTTEPEQPSEPDIVPVESISISGAPETMTVGDGATLTAVVTPDSAADRTVSWTSDNSSVIEVRQDGTIVAKNEGTAVITAIAGGKYQSVRITVNKKQEVVDPVDPGDGGDEGGEEENPEGGESQ